LTTENSHSDDGMAEIDGEVRATHVSPELNQPSFMLQRTLQGIGAVIILVLAVFITISVVLRYTGNGILGSVEIAALGMVVITVLVVPATAAADENFRVELVDFFVSKKTLSWLDVLSIIMQTLVALFLAVAAFQLLIHDISTGTTTGGELSIPRWWVTLPIAVGFLGLVYSSFVVALMHSKSATTTSELPED